MNFDLVKKSLVLTVAVVLFVVYCILAIKAEALGFDFKLRYNEVKCVLGGTDPLFIWNGTVSSSVYMPFEIEHFFHDKGLNLVHSYPTWAYTYLMPLAMFPRPVAMVIFVALEFAGVIVLLGAAFHWGVMRRRRIWEGGLCLAVALIGVGEPMMCCLHVLNYGILIAVAILGMIVCLNRGHDILAGLCWAFMMVKPQLAVIFAIPLLIGGKWKTIVSMVVTCLLASVPPAILCGRSPMAMILSILEYSREYQLEMVARGFPLLPTCVVKALPTAVKAGGLLAINALLGWIGCSVATWWVRNHKDWLFRLLPAVIFCVLWMVSRVHDYVCLVFMYIGAVVVLLDLMDKLYGGDTFKKKTSVQHCD